MPLTKKEIQALTAPEMRLKVVREYTQLWQQYFRFFADSFEGRAISDKEEHQFFQSVGYLALGQYRFTQLAGDYFRQGDEILKVLQDTPSLSAIKAMSEAQFSRLQIDWHGLFISMNKAIGKLILIQPVPKEGKRGAPAAGQAA